MKKLSKTLVELVKILSDGNAHDGSALGQKLGITRAAIWKVIKKLQKFGFIIDASKELGYKLNERLILLDIDRINNNIKNIPIEIFEEIDSTNDYLKKYIGGKSNHICIAESMTKGKGRLGRTWYSPFGQNIYFSILQLFKKDVSELMGLSIAISLAIAKTLHPYLKDKLKIKWPNDLLANGKKLCGVLLEIQAEANGLSYAIIGIGINVNMVPKNKPKIDQSWASLRTVTNEYYDRNELLVNLINNVLEYIKIFDQFGLEHFMQEWKKYDHLVGRNIAVTSFNNIIKGKVRGINDLGNLVLELEDGSIQILSSGDTSIVKN